MSTGMILSMPGDGGIVLVEPAAGRACAERHHPLGLAHLLVDPQEDGRLLVRERADDHQQVRLPWRKARQRGAEAVGVVGRGTYRHELHRAASGHERVGKQRELARPTDEFVLLGREVLERGRWRTCWQNRDGGLGHRYSVTASSSLAWYTYSRISTRRKAKMKNVNSMKPVSGWAPSAQMNRNTVSRSKSMKAMATP